MKEITWSIEALIEGMAGVQLLQKSNKRITDLTLDSRKVRQGAMFFAVKGTLTDGHQYIRAAVANGASAIVLEDIPESIPGDISIVRTSNVPETMAEIAKKFFDNPAEKLHLIGITGTNGKTTIARLLYNTWQALGYTAGIISTIDVRIGGKIIPSELTTPDILSLHKRLYEMVRQGAGYVAMEVSSHAIEQGRIAGIPFSGAIFTNISHDHLDYHGDMKSYIYAKKKFFDHLNPEAFALVNIDDARGNVMIQNTRARRYSYALHHSADFKGKVISMDINGMELAFDGHRFFTGLTAKFNAYNLLACYAVCRIMGFEAEDTLRALSAAKSAEGRFERIGNPTQQITGIVDYAHTPDALKKVLEAIGKLRTGGNIITVFGCGGDRDKAKRPKMGQIAALLSDKVIITSDNPRTEDPRRIIDEIFKGVPVEHRKKVLLITDRLEAIRTAWMLAKNKDVILLAGKGHENYQIIGQERLHFDDKEILESLMNDSDKIIE